MAPESSDGTLQQGAANGVGPLMMVAVDRKVDRKEERHPVPHPNQKEITYLEVANVQFSHLLGVHQLAVITYVGASVVFVHVIPQRAAIQQGPGLAAQAYHE